MQVHNDAETDAEIDADTDTETDAEIDADTDTDVCLGTYMRDDLTCDRISGQRVHQ